MNYMSKYEVELRGLLKEKERKDLERFLVREGKLVKKYQRTQWCFGLSLKKKIDLRIKQTNGKWEFSLKVGTLGKSNRREIYLPIPKNKVKDAFDFAKYLGYYEGVKAVRNAKIYQYKGIEWAIVQVPNHSWYFEAEKLVKNKRDGRQAEAEIRSVCKNLELTIYNHQQTINYIAKLDREVNEKFKL